MAATKITLNSNIIGRSMQIMGHTLHFVDSEEGETPIILVHGLGFSLYSMRNVYNDLTDRGYRVIAIDIPGSGYSQASENIRLSPHEIAEVIHELMRALEIETANFYAIAEGAIYVMRLCQLYPECISSLMLVSPGSVTRHYPILYRNIGTSIIGPAIVKLMKRKHINKFLRWIMFDETAINPTLERQTFQPFTKHETKLGFLNLMRDYQDIKVFTNLSQITCPTLMLWGQYDVGHPVSMCDLFLKKIDSSTECIIPNCSHLIHEEKPRMVCNIIDKYLFDLKYNANN